MVTESAVDRGGKGPTEVYDWLGVILPLGTTVVLWPLPLPQKVRGRNGYHLKDRETELMKMEFHGKYQLSFMPPILHLFTAAPANSSSVIDASPQLVSLLKETAVLLHPILAKCPWKNLILRLLILLYHGVGKIPADEPHVGMRQDTTPSSFLSLSDLQ